MRLLSTHKTAAGEFIALVDPAGSVSITFSGPGLNPTGVIVPQEAREWAANVLGGAVVLQMPRHRDLVDVLGPVT